MAWRHTPFSNAGVRSAFAWRWVRRQETFSASFSGMERSSQFLVLRLAASRRLFLRGWCPACSTASVNTTRSEEHTSELQSRLHLVCRLLLEKKNQSVTAIHP